MTLAFKPVGERAKWEPIYDYMKALDFGAVASYEQLADVFGDDVRVDRAPLYRAIRQLERSDHRTLANVPGVGYRVVESAEHGDIARKHQRRSGRQIRKAKQKLSAADRSRLTPEECERFDSWEMRLSHAESMVRRLHARTAVLEKKAEKAEVGQERLAQDIDQVRAILQRHGLMEVAA